MPKNTQGGKKFRGKKKTTKETDGTTFESLPTGRIRDLFQLPEDLRRLFPTTFEVSVDVQVDMQAAFQRHVENAVSKTINLAPDATAAEVSRAFKLAHQLGLKGITVYRYGSRPGQVLSLPPEGLAVAHEFSEECRQCSV